MADEHQPLMPHRARRASRAEGERISDAERRHERTLFVHWLAAAVDGTAAANRLAELAYQAEGVEGVPAAYSAQ